MLTVLVNNHNHALGQQGSQELKTKLAKGDHSHYMLYMDIPLFKKRTNPFEVVLRAFKNAFIYLFIYYIFILACPLNPGLELHGGQQRASVDPGLGLGACSKVSNRLKKLSNESALCKRKRGWPSQKFHSCKST